MLDIKYRIEVLLNNPSNQICADCPAKNPRWVSFLEPLVDECGGFRGSFGVFCCLSCAQHHQFELSERQCRIKSLEMTSECK